MIPARFWSKVNMEGPMLSPYLGPCWLWTAATSSGGYGNYVAKPKTVRSAHRWLFEEMLGPVPEGLQLDHLCRNRACVNPAHLEAVTVRENLMRGDGWTARNARKTHCVHGHEFTSENIYYAPGKTYRWCQECRREHSRKEAARRKEKRALEGRSRKTLRR